uniref:Uncharacterized protein n=1 Tax=Panagrolaimus sp. ES5 TaxID=591445 RepID=A0AC34GVX1_9BILA
MDDNRKISAPKEFQRDESLHVHPTDNSIDETNRGHVHEALHKVKESVKDGVKDVVDKVKGRDSSSPPKSTAPDYYHTKNL